MRFREAVEALIRRGLSSLPFLGTWPATVVSQSGNELELTTDPDVTGEKRLPDEVGVAIRPGLPGVTVTVPAGSRVQLAYEQGDPRKPVTAAWEAGTGADEIRITVAGQPAEEHVLTTEAAFNILNGLFVQIGIQSPGALTGAGLAALAVPILSAVAAAAGTSPQLAPIAAALDTGFSAAPPKPPGVPGQGQIFPGLGAKGFQTG